MFNTRKFGGYLSQLRKKADMTQSELADTLNLTRQAVSRYELGESFPDVSVLVLIADIFGVSVDELINSGEPTRGESLILGNIVHGNSDVVAEKFSDIVGLAPLLKPSIIDKLASCFSKQGIDISAIVDLAEYLNDESVLSLLENATFDSMSPELLEKFVPLLDDKSKNKILEKILSGEMDWHFLRVLLVYIDFMSVSLIEAAVIEGALPKEALNVIQEAELERLQMQSDDEK